MRIGVYGGSFDPVHLGHLLLAECCREQLQLDEVLFTPAGVAPHKHAGSAANAAQRQEMLRLAIAGRSDFAVCTLEVDRGGLSYTVDTLRTLAAERPEDQLFLLLGADMAADLPNWREPDEICRLALPVCAARAGQAVDWGAIEQVASPDRAAEARAAAVAMPAIGVSSSDLRARAAAGRSLRYRTPRAVEEYIRAHRIYCDSAD